MDDLVMPGPPSRPGVQRDEAVGVQVAAHAVAAPKVERGRARRAEDQPARLVEGKARPHVRPAGVLVGRGRPRLMAWFAWSGDGVEAPDQRARAQVVGPHGPGRGRRRPLAQAHPYDQQVPEDDARRVRHQGEAPRVAAQPLHQVHRAVAPKRPRPPARPGIQRMQVVAVPVDHATVRAVRPMHQAAIHARLGQPGVPDRIKPPQLAARRRIQREALKVRRRPVQHAVHDQRVALDLGAVVRVGSARAIRPGHPQPCHVRGREVAQRGIMRRRLVAEVGGPGNVGGARRGRALMPTPRARPPRPARRQPRYAPKSNRPHGPR